MPNQTTPWTKLAVLGVACTATLAVLSVLEQSGRRALTGQDPTETPQLEYDGYRATRDAFSGTADMESWWLTPAPTPTIDGTRMVIPATAIAATRVAFLDDLRSAMHPDSLPLVLHMACDTPNIDNPSEPLVGMVVENPSVPTSEMGRFVYERIGRLGRNAHGVAMRSNATPFPCVPYP